MIGRKVNNNCCQQEYNRREHFNCLRNNSNSIFDVMTWQGHEEYQEQIFLKANNYTREENYQQRREEEKNTNLPMTTTNNRANTPGDHKKLKMLQQQNQQNLNKRSSSLKKTENPTKTVKILSPEKQQLYAQKTQQQTEKKQQNREKVQNYIESMIPFSRNLTNSKFQQYFGKAALQTYGRGNTHQPMGGIIYGNHLKTFNINPHSYANAPQNYQTYTTAINYGKRTKLNEQERLNKLQRTLTKKLGLNDYNHTLKEGKEVNYVDVDDSNMYAVMKENNQFIKSHRNQIRDAENQFKEQKEQQSKVAKQQFYIEKKARMEKNLNQTMNKSTLASSYFQGKDEASRIKQQVIYRHHDQKGNIRLGADRHALTCYVDTNFPQNDAAYTEELKSRMPIFPIPTKQQDKNLDGIRRENYNLSLNNIYPSHYLLPNCQQPELLKMFGQRAGRISNKSKFLSAKRVQQARPASVKQISKNGNSNQRYSNEKDNQNIRNQNNTGNNTGNITRNNTKYQDGGNNRSRGQERDQYTYDAQDIDNKKQQIIRRAWENANISESILNKKCSSFKHQCNHLPNNQKNPQNYRQSSGQIGYVPVAGK